MLRIYLFAALFFVGDLRRVIKREKAEPGYLSQDEFETCGKRATAFMREALTGEDSYTRRFVEIVFIRHRMAKPSKKGDRGHGETWRSGELDAARDAAPKRVDVAATVAGWGTWWNG